MKNYEFTIGVSYICLWIGFAIASIGQKSEVTIFSWGIPFKVAIAFTLPFVLGFLAGKKAK